MPQPDRLSSVTIVCVDGRQGDLTGAQLSILKSGAELPGARRLLISPAPPADLHPSIRHVPIAPLGYLEYGLFMLYALHEFIETDHALIVQDDGWVLDGRNWRDAFLDYDYIGAPIHFGRVRRGDQTVWLRKFEWLRHLDDPAARVDFVQNGGFCLRSRRLLAALSREKIPFTLPAMAAVQGPPYRMRWESDSHMEDVHLCLDLRDRLEEMGLRFAPLDVALGFAFEHLHPRLHGAAELAGVLGHHSKLRKLRGGGDVVQYRATRAQVSAIYGEERICALLDRRGYRIAYPGQ